MTAQLLSAPMLFQSTPPVKAATVTAVGALASPSFQSTPPVKAATLPLTCKLMPLIISIHAAREGGDSLSRRRLRLYWLFQSTPPVKAATDI